MRAIKKMLLACTAAGVMAVAVSASALCAQINVDNGATYAVDEAGKYTVSVAAEVLSGKTGQMTVLVTPKGALEKEGGLQDSDILYIDQLAAADGIFQGMGVKDALVEGSEYDVFVGGENVTNEAGEASFYRTSFTVKKAGGTHVVELGKVDDDNSITGADALMVLQAAAESITLTGDKRIAADCDLDGSLTGADALKVLQAAAENIVLGKVNVDNTTGKVVGEPFFN